MEGPLASDGHAVGPGLGLLSDQVNVVSENCFWGTTQVTQEEVYGVSAPLTESSVWGVVLLSVHHREKAGFLPAPPPQRPGQTRSQLNPHFLPWRKQLPALGRSCPIRTSGGGPLPSLHHSRPLPQPCFRDPNGQGPAGALSPSVEDGPGLVEHVPWPLPSDTRNKAQGQPLAHCMRVILVPEHPRGHASKRVRMAPRPLLWGPGFHL